MATRKKSGRTTAARKTAHATSRTRSKRTDHTQRTSRQSNSGAKRPARRAAGTVNAGPLPQRAIALSNNDVTLIAWSYPQAISGCLGFAVYRHDLNARSRTPLPAWVGFAGDTNDSWTAHTTIEWPVQKFQWKDLTAQRGGFYQYEIVPMVGQPGALTAQTNLTLMTNPVHMSADRGDASSYFNRGILSTQSLRKDVPPGPSGAPNYLKLQGRINQPGDPLRAKLTGDLCGALVGFLDRAKTTGGSCYASLYELSDPQLQQLLIGSPYVHLILTNTGVADTENAPVRQALHESHTDVTDRMLPNGSIGHNKFVVYVDASKKPRAVLTGSTNWTPAALCGQSNNALIIENDAIAAAYFDYWQRIKADTNAATGGPKTLQGPTFRSDNTTPHDCTADGGRTKVRIWFSPNTPHTRSKNSPTPPDLQDVFDAIDRAKSAVVFLVFQPGVPSIVDEVAKTEGQNSSLFVRGAVTDPKAAGEYYTDLYHRSAAEPDETVVAASAIDDQFGYWQKELLKTGPKAHAIIHDKIVVIDPLSDDCVVIVGSHNLGYRASYNNDENLLIIRGNRALAESYACHVIDVYDHYRFRAIVNKEKDKAWSGLARKDTWQQKYFDTTNRAYNEIQFWMSYVDPVQSPSQASVTVTADGARSDSASQGLPIEVVSEVDRPARGTRTVVHDRTLHNRVNT